MYDFLANQWRGEGASVISAKPSTFSLALTNTSDRVPQFLASATSVFSSTSCLAPCLTETPAADTMLVCDRHLATAR